MEGGLRWEPKPKANGLVEDDVELRVRWRMIVTKKFPARAVVAIENLVPVLLITPFRLRSASPRYMLEDLHQRDQVVFGPSDSRNLNVKLCALVSI